MQPYSQFPCFAPYLTTQNIATSRPGGGFFLISRLVFEWIRFCHPMQDNIMRIIDKTLSDRVAKTTNEYAKRAVEQNV